MLSLITELSITSFCYCFCVIRENVCFYCSDVIKTYNGIPFLSVKSPFVSCLLLLLSVEDYCQPCTPPSLLKVTYILSIDCHHKSTFWCLLYNHTYCFNSLIHSFLNISILSTAEEIAYGRLSQNHIQKVASSSTTAASSPLRT